MAITIRGKELNTISFFFQKYKKKTFCRYLHVASTRRIQYSSFKVNVYARVNIYVCVYMYLNEQDKV